MNVRNCRKCGKLFNHISGMPICPGCKDDLEKKFSEVKKYVREHPNADMKIVSEECEVEVSQIKQWIREERLEFTEDSQVKMPCESCGTMIRSGRFCDKCKDNMSKNLSNAIDKPKRTLEPEKKKPTHERDRMRFLDR